jgi:hypothetical protein
VRVFSLLVHAYSESTSQSATATGIYPHILKLDESNFRKGDSCQDTEVLKAKHAKGDTD